MYIHNQSLVYAECTKRYVTHHCEYSPLLFQISVQQTCNIKYIKMTLLTLNPNLYSLLMLQLWDANDLIKEKI